MTWWIGLSSFLKPVPGPTHEIEVMDAYTSADEIPVIDCLAPIVNSWFDPVRFTFGCAVKVRVAQGNVLPLTFRFTDSGRSAPIDLSSASLIELELTKRTTNPDGATIAPIVASPSYPGADWTNGVVVIPIDGDVSDDVTVWDYSIFVTQVSRYVILTGTLEIVARPGYTP